ncbi:AraC family transcriptional regulator [Diplocloster modestus]|uniref:AraC family transcriptional regulator n=1 Tax=Diplocloster modestus TaxID=2850322 RepID=A0ABS6K661_9FIRM|nr:AraC family transcriptional regulator [Diplocloster modestus]MBU9725983.1 AraC family transcriptional regulator [Diplocloster modestus]
MIIEKIPGILSIYFCGSEQCTPGHSFGPAVRPHYLIHTILDGRGTFIRNGKTYRLEAGDAFLISPMESTFYQADRTDPWKYAWIGFDGMGVEEYVVRTCFRNSPVYRCPEDRNTRPAMTSVMSAITDAFLATDQNSLTLMGYFFHLLGIMQGTQPFEDRSHIKGYLEKAIDYIHNNYSYNIHISDIAAYIGVDRSYLYRLFMQEEHISPKQYLMRLRLRTASGMLHSPQYTITEIAYSCGFRDTATFCNQFKKSMKLTPSQFRKEAREETVRTLHFYEQS